jgi:cell fate (sporulation/competence/biofilm development) regulator YlbF (YheA/YmcA/DUF963 family)
MSSTSIELFRQHTEKQRQGTQTPDRASQAQERGEPTEKPSLVAEMSRMQHAIHQLFDEASPADRENIMRILERLIRNLMRQAANE